MQVTLGRIALVIALLVMIPLEHARAQQDETINDKDILIIHFEEIAYPTFALNTRLQGVVVVRVGLDDAGKVLNAVAISGHEWLIPASLANAKTLQFQPNSRKIAIVVYNFRLADGDCHTTTQTILQARNLITVTSCPMISQAPTRSVPAPQ
jgi:hypothetical protein